jgi:hypothetical protein
MHYFDIIYNSIQLLLNFSNQIETRNKRYFTSFCKKKNGRNEIYEMYKRIRQTEMDVKERAGRGWEGNGKGLWEESGRGQGWSCVKADPH